MNRIQKAYNYIFYKMYKFSEASPMAWWSEWKASSCMDILLIIIVLTICNYYNVFIDRYTDLYSNNLQVVLLALIIIGFNHYLFNYNGKWKNIVDEFDRLPKKKNRVGSWFVFLFILFVFFNLIYSFYLFSQIDWSQYR